MTRIILTFSMLFVFQSFFSQLKELTKKEKKEDFIYLYNELKASYPYFEINKRVNNIDWVKRKKSYLKKISKTRNNYNFLIEMQNIINDLNNGHTDFYPTFIYSYFYDAYKFHSKKNNDLKVYVNELELSDTTKTNYWKKINKRQILSKKEKVEKATVQKPIDVLNTKNTIINLDKKQSIATLKIKSFSYDLLQDDIDILNNFTSKIRDYDHLIIDIQGNTGGDEAFWSENIIPFLINDTIKYKINYAFKNSKRIKDFKPRYFKNTIIPDKSLLRNIPEEIIKDKYLFKSSNRYIIPKSKKKYNGRIYLLVDEKVYSSAEMLAYFFKYTKFGLVVGVKTAGDGVGTDPILITLPNSGLVLRFTSEIGLNPDGSSNEESKTMPDIILKSSGEKNRLLELKKLISLDRI